VAVSPPSQIATASLFHCTIIWCAAASRSTTPSHGTDRNNSRGIEIVVHIPVRINIRAMKIGLKACPSIDSPKEQLRRCRRECRAAYSETTAYTDGILIFAGNNCNAILHIGTTTTVYGHILTRPSTTNAVNIFGSSGIGVGRFMPLFERLALCLWSLERCWKATESVCWNRTA